MFIVFEGIDGAGKSTLAKKLYTYLQESGIKSYLTSEPRNPFRELILNKDICPEAEFYLFMADRAQHLNDIRPLLKDTVVISDRFVESTFAYQTTDGAGLFDKNHVLQINDILFKGFTPDLTFILSLGPEQALARATEKNKFEARGLEYYKKIANFYSKYQNNPRYIYLDATLPVDQLFNSIINIYKERMNVS